MDANRFQPTTLAICRVIQPSNRGKGELEVHLTHLIASGTYSVVSKAIDLEPVVCSDHNIRFEESLQ